MILDTAIVVANERGHLDLDDLIADDDDVSIAAVTAAELLLGALASDPDRRLSRTRQVEDVLRHMPIDDYDLAVARAHAALLLHTRTTGRPRGAHDLIIAATAAAHARTVVTSDRVGFDDLPGVDVKVV